MPTLAHSAAETVAREIPLFPQERRLDLPSRDPSDLQVEIPLPRLGMRYLAQTIATSFPLILSDALALAITGALVAIGLQLALPQNQWHKHEMLLALVGGLVLGANFCVGLYPAVGLARHVEFRRTALAITLVVAVAGATTFLIGQGSLAAPWFWLAIWLVAMVLVPWMRAWTRSLCARWDWWGYPALIFGAGAEGEAAYANLKKHRTRGLRPVGLLDEPHHHWRDATTGDAPLLGAPADAAEISQERGAYWAVMAISDRSHQETKEILDLHCASIPHLLIPVGATCPAGIWTQPREFGGAIYAHIEQRLLLPLPRALKRALDLALTLAVGLVATPFFLLISLLIKATSRGPIFYRQLRIGRRGQTFSMWKFRSMVVDSERQLEKYLAADPAAFAEWERDRKLRRDPRVTWIGYWLRKSSLDELPQLLNVLRGEMRFVGPRPLPVGDAVRYSEKLRIYGQVPPGMTGLWQVSGRNNSTYDERINYDIYYVRNWTPCLDLFILARTISVVLRGEGAY